MRSRPISNPNFITDAHAKEMRQHFGGSFSQYYDEPGEDDAPKAVQRARRIVKAYEDKVDAARQKTRTAVQRAKHLAYQAIMTRDRKKALAAIIKHDALLNVKT